mgnify:FL=1
MILRSDTLRRIAEGTITLAFRRWTRPSVKSAGTLMTAAGKLQIRSVTPVTEAEISEGDAMLAGYSSRQELLDDLAQRKEGVLFRVGFGAIEPDPRLALRDAIPSAEEAAKISDQLRQIDTRSGIGAWTTATLDVIHRRPGVLAEKLAAEMHSEQLSFKARVRKLKALGLTISLGTGYRLSPRGEAVLAALKEETTIAPTPPAGMPRMDQRPPGENQR